MGGLEPWHIIVIVAVLFLLFGYRKLPSATKSIAQSLKIFRDETKGLRGGDDTVDSPVGEHLVGTNTGTGALAAPPMFIAPVPAAPVAHPIVQPAPSVVSPSDTQQPVNPLAPRPATQSPGSAQSH